MNIEFIYFYDLSVYISDIFSNISEILESSLDFYNSILKYTQNSMTLVYNVMATNITAYLLGLKKIFITLFWYSMEVLSVILLYSIIILNVIL